MDQDFYTVTEVAKRLKLHVKTVLIYVREGRLKAMRIGKQYRIAKSDLEKFAGGRMDVVEPRRRSVEVSSIVEIGAISADAANRTVTHLQGALNAREHRAVRTRLDTIYYEEEARLKLVVLADLATTSTILRLVEVLIAP